MYKLDRFGGIIREADGASIPKDPQNADYQQFKRWERAGGTVTKFVLTSTEVDRPIIEEIKALEIRQARAVREAILYGEKENLLLIEERIRELRRTLAG